MPAFLASLEWVILSVRIRTVRILAIIKLTVMILDVTILVLISLTRRFLNSSSKDSGSEVIVSDNSDYCNIFIKFCCVLGLPITDIRYQFLIHNYDLKSSFNRKKDVECFLFFV